MKVLITGAVGFMGYHLTIGLLVEGQEVVEIDYINDYYDPLLNHAKHEEL